MNYIKFPSNLHHLIFTLFYFILRFHSVWKYFSRKCIIDLVVLDRDFQILYAYYISNISILVYVWLAHLLCIIFPFYSWSEVECRFCTTPNSIAIQDDCYTPLDLRIFKSISDFFIFFSYVSFSQKNIKIPMQIIVNNKLLGPSSLTLFIWYCAFNKKKRPNKQ